MTDPLAGYRNEIANREVQMLRYPAARQCPVNKGDRFEIRGWLTIEIDRVVRKLIKGRPAEWHVTWIRHEKDRPQLLRFTPPTRAPRQADSYIGLSERERARREGNYTTSSHAASPHEPESVGPDWEDPGKMRREIDRQSARRELEIERQEQAARRELGRLMRGLTIDQREEMLRDLCQLMTVAGQNLGRAA